MKIGLTIAAAIDATAILVLSILTAHFGGNDSTGVTALGDMGRFVVCLILLIAALLGGIVLGIIALTTHRRK